MAENHNPEQAPQGGTDDRKAAGGDLKEAARTNIENVREGQKADELRQAAQGKAQEIRGAAESVLADTRSQVKDWRTEGEAYVREKPSKAGSFVS